MKWMRIRLKMTVLGITLALVCHGDGNAQPEAGLEHIPSLVAACRVRGPLTFCGEAVPLNDADVRERLERELLLCLWDRAQVILWLKRAGRYFTHFERALKEAGLPEDLKYLAVAESSLKPAISSNKGAVGLWQFIEATGQRYGLTVEGGIDQRRDMTAATSAALRYLKDLYAMFGSWPLAAAAYNMGENGLKAQIQIQQTRDYYNLYLPEETQRYVFRILSVKLILADPRRYGFDLEAEDIYPPLAYDRVQLNLTRDVAVLTIAQAAGTYYKTIRDLNPQIRSTHLVRGTHTISLPPGAAQGFAGRLKAALADTDTQDQEQAPTAPPAGRQMVTVKPGESLSAIARRYNISAAQLAAWNGLKVNSPIRPGQKLVVSAP